MKKALSLLLAGVMCIGLLAGCGGQNTEDTQGSDSTPDASSSQETGNKTIDTLRIAFVPSREPEEIITATEPLKQMLTDELAKLGYDVGEVDITVGTSYEAVGEALAAGTADAVSYTHLDVYKRQVFIANGIPLSAMRQALSGGKGFHCLCAAIPEGGKHPLPRPCRPGAWSVSRLPLPVSVWPAPPDHRRRSRAPTPPRCPAPSGVRR